jgi:hypothetical protein
MNLKLHTIALAVLLPIGIQAQQLRLKTGTTTHQSQSLPSNQLWQGRNYFIVQFKKTPNQAERNQILKTGIRLMGYLPDYAYYASVPAGFKMQQLNPWLHACIALSNDNKMSNALYVKDIPEHAKRGNNVALTIKLHDDVLLLPILNDLQKSVIEIENYQTAFNTMQVVVPVADITKIANLPYVQFIEPIGVKGEPENYIEVTNHRSNAISTQYAGGRKYNGSGVTVGIGDDGIIGPHIDYAGRIDQSLSSGNSGDHGDHCSGIIMGAGNIDPRERGQAWGSFLYVYEYPDNLNQALDGYDNFNIRINSSSYSDGCNAGYTAFAQQCDNQTRLRPELILSFSAGNQGGINCGYYSGSDFGQITGGHKIGKNVITAASLNANDGITSYSSRGPTADGRIAPLVSAVGDNVNSTVSVNDYQTNSGTSMSCPAVSGVLAQLYDCYKQTHGGVNPNSALIKATLLNSCDDLGNAGADFVYGYGRINAFKSAVNIESNHHFAASLTHGDSTSFSLNVPANATQLKVMLYWHDYEGALNAAPALVNDLDFEVIDDLGNVTLPLVPNSAPNFASLISAATQKVDHLNNQEQVVIDNPTGTYTLKVKGYNIPQGPQDFYVVYSFTTDEIMVTYPLGGESVAPGEVEKIRWDAFGNTTPFTVSYSADSGNTWNVINANVPANRRYLDWTTPATPAPTYLIKVERNGIEDVSDATFNLMQVPTGLTVDYACPDSIKISWNAVAGAAYYEASRLGNMYMDSNGISTTTSYTFGGLNPLMEQWFSVKAYHSNGAVSRRAIAIKKDPGITNCILAYDAGVTGISPANLNLLSCVAPDSVKLTIGITNGGANPISNFDVAYTVNNSTPVVETFTNTIAPGANTVFTFNTAISTALPGSYQIYAYHLLSGDGNMYNDSLPALINIVNSTPVTLPYEENFESFTQCNTSSDCEATICPLGNDLTNVTNGDGDDIDWRVNSGSTPSATTGPTFDHTTGNSSGKYVYTEASNNCFQQTAQLITPCIDLANATNPVFAFYYHMFGDDMGDLHVDIFAGNTWINDVIAPISGSQPDDWFKQIVGLNNYIGQVINVRLRGTTGNQYSSDMALDDIGAYESVAGINSVSQASNLIASPNPGNGLFNIQLAGAPHGTYHLQVFDAAGKQIINANINNQNSLLQYSLDLQTQPKGVYTLKLINQNKVLTQKIIKL